MSQSHFFRVMSRKSEAELQRVVSSPGTYAEQAQLAAAYELRNRGISSEETELLISKLSIKLETDLEARKITAKLTSKHTIYLWALLVTPLFIGPFMAGRQKGNLDGAWTRSSLPAFDHYSIDHFTGGAKLDDRFCTLWLCNILRRMDMEKISAVC